VRSIGRQHGTEFMVEQVAGWAGSEHSASPASTTRMWQVSALMYTTSHTSNRVDEGFQLGPPHPSLGWTA
jgi:hypothetical protein